MWPSTTVLPRMPKLDVLLRGCIDGDAYETIIVQHVVNDGLQKPLLYL